MMGFLEWVEFNRKKKDKVKKNERSNSQTGGEVGNQMYQGETSGPNQEIDTERISYFSELR